jgi:hypothetical protein
MVDFHNGCEEITYRLGDARQVLQGILLQSSLEEHQPS